MTDPKTIAAQYLALWNEGDGARRRALLTEHWANDARYVDPMMNGSGHEGIAAMIEGARAQFPGYRFDLAGSPDGHGEHVRFSWTLASERSAPIAAGTDMVRLDGDGRITDVVGFLDAAA